MTPLRFSTPHAGFLLQLIGGILLALMLLISSHPAEAQEQGNDEITIVESYPRANAVLETGPPEQITLAFSAEITADRSSVRVLGQDGAPLPGTTTAWAPAGVEITLPEDVPNGSWLVVWEIVTADDATGSGFYGFTVGADQDVAPLTIPDTGFDPPAGPAWLSRISSAGIFFGGFVLMAIWPIWHLLMKRQASPALWRHAQRHAMIAAGITAIGAIGLLVAETWGDPATNWPSRLQSVLGDPHRGWVVLALIGAISLHSLLLALLPSHPQGWRRTVPWLTTVSTVIPLALLTHAAEEPAGRIPSITIVSIALLAVALPAGGASMHLWLRMSPSSAFRPLLITCALVLVPAVGYLMWLFVGNETALRETLYGTLSLLAIASLLALFVLLVMSMRSSLDSAHRPSLFLSAALLIVLSTLLGMLTTSETARAELTQEATQRELPFTLGEDRAQLILAPGTAGVNHIRLEIDRNRLPQQTRVDLTMELPSMPELGNQTVPLSRVSETAFEYHGAEMIIADVWDLGVTLHEPNRPASTSMTHIDLAREATAIDIPATPWRFAEFAGTAGMLMIAIGIAGIVIGIAAGKSPLRMESAGLGATALILATILLGQGRLDPILAAGGSGGAGAINPDDLTMITRGEEVYAQFCLTCHGAELRGDGPESAGLQPPPADFAEPHTKVHDEATLIYWLRNGKQGTAMPAFGDVLSDDEIRAVLSYVEREQRDLDEARP